MDNEKENVGAAGGLAGGENAPCLEDALSSPEEAVSGRGSDAGEPSESLVKREPSVAFRREAKRLYREARKLFASARRKLPENARTHAAHAIDLLGSSLKHPQGVDAGAYEEVKSLVQTRLRFAKKSSVQEIIESLVFALLFALILRTFFVEPFMIPTRSMVPTLLDGDQLFVTKLSYGIRLPFLNDYIVRFGNPQHGDVVVFAFPQKEAREHLARTNSGCMLPESTSQEKDYIKRIIGVEGDVIEVIEQNVHVNGEPIAHHVFYEREVSDMFYSGARHREQWNRETHGNATYTTITHNMPMSRFGPVTVAPGHVFVMGDNRDNSSDSRCWGQVPVRNIKGRAQIIWWSSGSQGLRWDRMFTRIY
ncbi:MAG: signal peptidase I [Proteobacteria bacterium]|nr:signal peptidase I [Pseudomonadota bacterium]